MTLTKRPPLSLEMQLNSTLIKIPAKMFDFFRKKKLENTTPVGITELVFRDAHQSLLATRLRIDDMLPIASALDEVGYWSIESWGGATFDACIRYLGEDPWERIREIKKIMPKTPQQMLLRGQNLLGYRHYGDDIVRQFINRSVENGITVFRVFDAMNDMRNLKTAINEIIKLGGHAQGTISYTVSPVHTIELWVKLAKQIEDMGAHSLCIKDMAGLLQPYIASKLVKQIKRNIHIPIQLHCHATTGLSTASIIKSIEAGADRVDSAIGSMSMTYGHSATNSIVSILNHTPRSTGLDLNKLEKIDSYFRPIRAKYAQFEGSLRGVDSRILSAQVPGGMLTNMENQLKEQNALNRMDEVLVEIARVREDLGYLPLVTPTSQIVGTQSVLNILTGERYKTITKESAGVLRGEYGATPVPVNRALQEKVLDGKPVITCRPADLIEPEFKILEQELHDLAKKENLKLAENKTDDLLTYALFPQVAVDFFRNRNNPDFFEAVPNPNTDKNLSANTKQDGSYTVSFKHHSYVVEVSGGEVTAMHRKNDADSTENKKNRGSNTQAVNDTHQNVSKGNGDIEHIPAPLSGNIRQIKVREQQKVSKGDVLIILEAMKMETEIRSARSGVVIKINVEEGHSVNVGDNLLSVG